ncbi:L-rhamnose mutarotase [Pacificibacter marinus]|nr:L-rhamnose mutarotase [Pacificibacter sp. 1_MG-2023]MBU2935956.1 L-rhamnose mutarotase [Pacificibacter marinus]MDO6614452.1 L-rhamnose mutarotase [Pacificibacter sp. 1_MG-2023]
MALNLSEKLRLFVICVSCLHGWIHLSTLSSFAGPLQYTIYLRRPENILFGHWESHGQDWAADQAALDASPAMQKWLAICGPMQIGLSSDDDGWADMIEVFHLE